jgi:hypothetical protein
MKKNHWVDLTTSWSGILPYFDPPTGWVFDIAMETPW